MCVCSTCSFRCLGVFLKMSVYHHLKKKYVRKGGGKPGWFHPPNTASQDPEDHPGSDCNWL